MRAIAEQESLAGIINAARVRVLKIAPLIANRRYVEMVCARQLKIRQSVQWIAPMSAATISATKGNLIQNVPGIADIAEMEFAELEKRVAALIVFQLAATAFAKKTSLAKAVLMTAQDFSRIVGKIVEPAAIKLPQPFQPASKSPIVIDSSILYMLNCGLIRIWKLINIVS